MPLTRQFKTLVITGNQLLASSAPINFANFSGGGVLVPSGASATSLTFHVATTKDGTYHALYDSDGAEAVVTVAAGKAYPIPTDAFGFPWLKAVANADGDEIEVTLKG